MSKRVISFPGVSPTRRPSSQSADITPIRTPIQFRGVVSQDVERLKPGDPILLRKHDGGFAVGVVRRVQRAGGESEIVPCCSEPFAALDCVIGRLTVTQCDAEFTDPMQATGSDS